MSAALEAQEISGQADVVEIDFRGSNETLPDIRVIGLEEKDDKARLKQRQPFPGRRMGDARVASQAGEVHELADSPGAKPANCK